jgi:hypothetical protein
MGDNTPPFWMGRMMGFNKLVGGASSLLILVIGGIIAQRYGFSAISVANITLLVPILPLSFRLRELSSGIYDHQ